MHILLKGGYISEENMYVSVFKVIDDSANVLYLSKVKGRTVNTEKYKEHIGFIKALEHAIAWAVYHDRKELLVYCENPSQYSFLDKKRNLIKEERLAKTFITNAQVKVIFKEDV